MNAFFATTCDRPAANDRGPGIACAISGIPTPPALLTMLGDMPPSLAGRIEQDFPGLAPTALISRTEAERYRALLIGELLSAEQIELAALDQRVLLANRVAGGNGAIDPRPFALLQLILSDIAALQALVVGPQPRPAAEDADLGLRDRITDLIAIQWRRMLEIQHLQLGSLDKDNDRGRGRG
jgi:hypothetical protein